MSIITSIPKKEIPMSKILCNDCKHCITQGSCKALQAISCLALTKIIQRGIPDRFCYTIEANDLIREGKLHLCTHYSAKRDRPTNYELHEGLYNQPEGKPRE